MTTIKASCPTCGEVTLSAAEILLHIGTDSQPSSYGFSCPACGEFVRKPADERIVRLLLSGGVIPMLVDVPAEALERHEGPPLTEADVGAFADLLQGDDWFRQLTG